MSDDAIQAVVDSYLAIKNPHKRKLALEQISSLVESQEIEAELNSELTEAKEWFDKIPGHEVDETSHYIVNGDIREDTTIEKIQDATGFVDLVFTSPPYNAGIKYDQWYDKLEVKDYKRFLDDAIEACDSLLRSGGRFVINIRDIGLSTGQRLPIIVPLHHMLCTKRGYKYRGVHIWYKGREESSFAWGSYKSSQNPAIIDLFEYVYVFQKQGQRKTGTDDIQKTDFIETVMGIWKIRPVKKIVGVDKRNIAKHPCPFPPELARRVIKLYTWRGDIVLDPFGGVGNTTAGAIKAGRSSVSVDISEAYCNQAVKRIKRDFRDLIKVANTVQIRRL
jgi:site-specific DNA-methyltransferase (adenine-specific)